MGIERQTRFLSLEGSSLEQHLEISLPLIGANNAHTQLQSVERYVRDSELSARSIAVESHYIDRDFIEEYSVFYSKNLAPIPNSCRRVHFFRLEASEVEREIRRLREIRSKREFEQASRQFAADQYLGFSVIKPLPGCPVGRTVLRNFRPDSKPGILRDFTCACDYKIHLLGVPLEVRGLAFQQQDRGVSACATTALWCALQKARELEGGPPASPAQITLRASQYALPFGRPMPSDGLSLDQMCQAVHSLGYAPNVIRAEKFNMSRWAIYSAVKSGIVPVLILAKDKLAHAVAVAGMKLRHPHRPENPGMPNDDLAADLVGLYLHDDRFGPYMRATIKRRDEALLIHLEVAKPESIEEWQLLHILVPVHNKIRLSLPQLRNVARWLSFQCCRASRVPTEMGVWIERSHSYIESQIVGAYPLPPEVLERLCERIALSRYVGIVRLAAEDFGVIDVLLDTTSTENNLQCLAVIRRTEERKQTTEVATFLADKIACAYLG